MSAAAMAGGLHWAAPWLQPWRDPGERVAARHEQGTPLYQALNEQARAPVRFVPQEALPEGEPYEAFIARTRTCPTRDNLHDFFNGLAWLAFPQAKRRLNQLQSAEIEAGARTVRGPVRDAITVFDENGALLHAPPEIWEALTAREWRRLFVDLRPLWSQARMVLFGHALLEKLAAPRKDITAHVWRADAPADRGEADGWLAARLAPAVLAAKPFTPLPVLGIPGWCAENGDISFYDDRLVFRPAGRQNESTTVRPGPSRP